MEDIQNKLINKLKIAPIALFDLSKEELKIYNELLEKKIISKFIDNGSCNYPLSTLHRDAYYIRLN